MNLTQAGSRRNTRNGRSLETSKPTPIEIPPRPHLLVLTKQFYQLRIKCSDMSLWEPFYSDHNTLHERDTSTVLNRRYLTVEILGRRNIGLDIAGEFSDRGQR